MTLSSGKITTPTTVAGAIRLGSAALAVAGTLGAGAGYVDGYLGKAGTTSFLYPLGASNQNAPSANNPATGAILYSPITLSSPGGTALRYVAAPAPSNTSFTATDAQPLVAVSSREYYPLGTPGAASSSTITLPYTNFGTGSTGYVGTPATLTIAALNGSTGKWENLSSTATNATSNGTVTVTLNRALTGSYTALALASTTAANPLPVQLTTFTAEAAGTGSRLRWATASEVDNDHFEVEVSPDGRTFARLGTVAGHGTTLLPQQYGFTDEYIGRYGVALVYYRLRQVDGSGTSTYSLVQTVAGAGAGLTLYPNPAPHTATLSGATANSLVRVYDALGSLLLITQADATGTAALVLPASLPGGLYLVRSGAGPALRLAVE